MALKTIFALFFTLPLVAAELQFQYLDKLTWTGGGEITIEHGSQNRLTYSPEITVEHTFGDLSIEASKGAKAHLTVRNLLTLYDLFRTAAGHN